MLRGRQSCGRLFISYSRKNKAEVYPFAVALAAAGIDLWIDKEGIDPLVDFPAKIGDGLAHSHALLAWYSPQYAQSRYCQEELTAAWICARRLTHNVLSRIFILNPEESVDHIALGELARENYLAAPKDATSLTLCIGAIRERLAGLSSDLAEVRHFRQPEWYPSPLQGSARFVGRLKELWRIHTALNPVSISPREEPHVVVQLAGMGGVGKTLLAIEYAKRFGAAFPGGVYWLLAHGFDANKPIGMDTRERARREQVETIAIRHEINIKERDSPEVSRDLARMLAASGPYLWVVDDLPPGLNQTSEFPAWCSPSANGRTLITTRCKDYEGIGTTVQIDVLEPDPAYTLLTQARKPQTEQECQDAWDLTEDLGRHALALDITGHFLLKTKSFAALRQDLAGAQADMLGKLVAGLRGQLPGGHEKSIVATLLKSVELLGEEGLNFLRLACVLRGGTPIPFKLAKATFGHAFALSQAEAETHLLTSINQLETNSLASIVLGGMGGDALSIHTMVCYMMQHGDPAKGEAAGQRQMLREAAMLALDDLLGEDVTDIRKYATIEWEVSHAQHLAAAPQTSAEAWLCLASGFYEGGRGHYRKARKLAEKALPIFERVLGKDDPSTLATRGHVALITGASGDQGTARRLAEDLLPDMERVLGKDDSLTLMTRGHVALITGASGDQGTARRLAEDLLPDMERVLGKDDPLTLMTRGHVALITLGRTDHPYDLIRAFLPGRTDDETKALRLYQDLLPDMERVLGKDHPLTLITRGNIAYLNGGADALRLYQDLLPDLERVLGKDHPKTRAILFEVTSWSAQRRKRFLETRGPVTPIGSFGRDLSSFETSIKLSEQNLSIDEKKFLGLLAGSVSLSKDEKRRIIEAVPRLRQQQVDSLIRILEEERQKFSGLDRQHKLQLDYLGAKHAHEWAELEIELTTDERKRNGSVAKTGPVALKDLLTTDERKRNGSVAKTGQVALKDLFHRILRRFTGRTGPS